jgi:heat shock protein HslJ
MKKTLFTTLILGIAFSGVSVFADTDVVIPSSPALTAVSPVTEKEEIAVSTRYNKIQLRGNILITERINSLNANAKVIAADKTLTAEQKNALSALITTNITGLTALRASLASSTDATSTKALVSSIFTNFRIYGIVVPQIRIEKRIYDLQNHTQKLSDTFLKVQAKIDEAKGKGKDVAVWQKSLDDSKILVANDMNTLATLFTTVSALKPADYGTSSKATIEQANTTLKSVLKDFNSIKKNLHRPTMVSSRKIVGGGTTTPSPLFGTSWTWVSSTVSGVTTTAPTGGKFVLSFGEDNHVNSTTDCNGVGGSYTLGANNGMTFGPFMSTMMFCEGSHEQEYSRALTSTTAYKVDGSNLTLTTASGTMVFIKK